jgi:hypothetical protein
MLIMHTTLPAPLLISGTLKEPPAAPDPATPAGRGGLAGALAALPTVQLGVGDAPHCKSLLSQVRKGGADLGQELRSRTGCFGASFASRRQRKEARPGPSGQPSLNPRIAGTSHLNCSADSGLTRRSIERMERMAAAV